MAGLKKIKFTLDKATGDWHAETSGFEGQGCGAVQQAFTTALGEAAAPMQVKPEFHRPCLQDNKITQGR